MGSSWESVLGSGAVSGNFSAREASVLHGRQVEIVREFNGLKPGLRGQVSEGRRMPQGWILHIGWDNGIRDNVTKRECLDHLRVLN
jgi:hypothetical protein